MMRCSRLSLNVGIVTKWMDDRGFGFVQDKDSQRQYFVHFRSLKIDAHATHRGLNIGSEVQFDPDDSDSRSQAVNVTSVGGGPLPPYDATPSNQPRAPRGNNNYNGSNGYNNNNTSNFQGRGQGFRQQQGGQQQQGGRQGFRQGGNVSNADDF